MLTDDKIDELILDTRAQMAAPSDLRRLARAIERAALEQAAKRYLQDYPKNSLVQAGLTYDWLRARAVEVPK